MANATVSSQSRECCDQAVLSALIGVLGMAAERGDPQVVRVEYRAQSGMTRLSPYALYAEHDQDQLVIFTGQPWQETLAIPRRAIVAIRFVHPSEIVRSLNAIAPATHALQTCYRASA